MPVPPPTIGVERDLITSFRQDGSPPVEVRIDRVEIRFSRPPEAAGRPSRRLELPRFGEEALARRHLDRLRL